MARTALDRPEHFRSLLEAAWPTMVTAISREAIPRDEVADVTQETLLALWKSRATIADCADDRDARGFVYTVAHHQAINAKRRTMRSRPLAFEGWYPDPDGPGDRERRFDGRHWTERVRYGDTTIDEVAPSARARRLRPRLSPVAFAFEDGGAGTTPPATASASGGTQRGGDLNRGRITAMGLSSALPGKGSDRPIRCLRCHGPCRHLDKVRPATCYAILALCESGGQLDDLLREGLSDQGIRGSHRRNRHLACCLALLDAHYPGIRGVEVLRALDSAISSCRSNKAYDAADRLSAWRRTIEQRSRDRGHQPRGIDTPTHARRPAMRRGAGR